MSKILGINLGPHETSLAYINNGEIVSLLELEKLTGIKSCYNLYCNPELGLNLLKEKYNLELKDFDHIAIVLPYLRKWVKDNCDSLFGKISTHSHHKCHALGSYFTSGFEGKVLSISHDGKGLNNRGKIYLCENGYFEEVHAQEISSTASIAGLWAASTIYMGWTMLKDEGKVVGLAGYGEFSQEIYDMMKEIVYYNNDFNFGPAEWENVWHYTFFTMQKEKFHDKQFRANFAYTLEFFTKELFNKYLKHVHETYPEYKKLCLSGGLFANVKLNQYINELPYFEEIYIHPAMSDSGLALGAAICKANELGEYQKPKKMQNAFYGQSFNKNDWINEISKHNNVKVENFDIKKVARFINDGHVVGLFFGRTEYGPRALGNRSIVVRPTDKETHKKLNDRLKRTEIMPFAPSVLEEYLDVIFENCKSKYAAEFMTLCYNTKKEWIKKIPAVIHEIDGSSRPQVVNKNRNPLYYSIINEYYQISGMPIILNTSFNAHGEPINNYPQQVIKHLLDNSIDYIITEDYILSKK